MKEWLTAGKKAMRDFRFSAPAAHMREIELETGVVTGSLAKIK